MSLRIPPFGGPYPPPSGLVLEVRTQATRPVSCPYCCCWADFYKLLHLCNGLASGAPVMPAPFKFRAPHSGEGKVVALGSGGLSLHPPAQTPGVPRGDEGTQRAHEHLPPACALRAIQNGSAVPPRGRRRQPAKSVFVSVWTWGTTWQGLVPWKFGRVPGWTILGEGRFWVYGCAPSPLATCLMSPPHRDGSTSDHHGTESSGESQESLQTSSLDQIVEPESRPLPHPRRGSCSVDKLKVALPGTEERGLPLWVLGQLASHFPKGHFSLHPAPRSRWMEGFNVSGEEMIGKCSYRFTMGRTFEI